MMEITNLLLSVPAFKRTLKKYGYRIPVRRSRPRLIRSKDSLEYDYLSIIEDDYHQNKIRGKYLETKFEEPEDQRGGVDGWLMAEVSYYNLKGEQIKFTFLDFDDFIMDFILSAVDSGIATSPDVMFIVSKLEEVRGFLQVFNSHLINGNDVSQLFTRTPIKKTEWRGTLKELAVKAIMSVDKNKYRTIPDACLDYSERHLIRGKNIKFSSLYSTVRQLKSGYRKAKPEMQ